MLEYLVEKFSITYLDIDPEKDEFDDLVTIKK